ncbi:Flp pilus assembly protein TadG [Microbacterium endophyticum]|uniref:Flp pilus assembly protein TadG n=1 Tax=Microbacterium endophyticum TaxID=1526412 RepID=A0A7W4V1D9_9MICO|nr:TadE family type IV pilus minor pilin [Microbacterium endophyticum]MBB2975088.1 Flp pilus assembly protein TadG [Microbacterium endophyticum]NIK37372.1 Flp pilus assembly protein TadG [Microbacterium endophyticum]
MTAEFAVALPAVLVVVALAVGTLGAASRHVRLQDAAADAARWVARGEDATSAIALVGDAVSGAAASIEQRGDLVCVVASAPAGVALAFVELHASSCALAGGI